MSRFQGSCEQFVRSSEVYHADDPIFMKADQLIDAEASLTELRKERFNYVTISGNAEIVITDKIKFDANVAAEQKIMKDLQSLIKLFNQLNPLFEEIHAEFPRLTEPTITGLKTLRNDLKSQNATFVQRIKNEFSHRVSSRGLYANVPIDQVIGDKNWLKFKEPNEKIIAENEVKIKKLTERIDQVESIFNEIFGK
jgi:hypothetical protein